MVAPLGLQIQLKANGAGSSDIECRHNGCTGSLLPLGVKDNEVWFQCKKNEKHCYYHQVDNIIVKIVPNGILISGPSDKVLESSYIFNYIEQEFPV